MNHQDYNEEIDLTKYYKLIYQNRRLLALFLFLGILFGYIANILPIYNYRAKVAIKPAMFSYSPLEPASQIVEKVKNGFYGKYPGLGAEYSIQTLAQVWADNKNKDEAKKIINAVVNNIMNQQKDMADKERKYREDNISKIKKSIDSFMAQGQETAPFQLRIFVLEDEISVLKPAEVSGEVDVSYKKINTKLSLILGLVFGFVLGIFYIFTKNWWMQNMR